MIVQTDFHLQKKPKPDNNEFAFTVTECYKLDNKYIYPTYQVRLPSDSVNFVKTDCGYRMKIAPNEVFTQLQEKEKELGIEITIYPKLNNERTLLHV